MGDVHTDFLAIIVFYAGYMLLLAVTFYIWVLLIQIYQEAEALRELAAEKLQDKAVYDALCGVAERCGMRMPHVYLCTRNHFNSYYFRGSVSPLGLRRGKIVISREFIEFRPLGVVQALFAHELGHVSEDRREIDLVGNDGDPNLEQSEQNRADVFAAEAVITMLDTIRVLILDSKRSAMVYPWLFDDAQRAYLRALDEESVGCIVRDISDRIDWLRARQREKMKKEAVVSITGC